MELLIWPVIIGGTILIIWYGYGLLVRQPASGGAGEQQAAQCHLCRREFPLGQMVIREKIAGFENYFCGDCIEALYNDYTAKLGSGGAVERGSRSRTISRN